MRQRRRATQGTIRPELALPLIELAPAGIAVLTPQLRVEAANRAFAELLDAEPLALAGRELAEFLVEADLQRITRGLRALVHAGDGRWTDDAELLGARLRHVRLSASAVRLDQGTLRLGLHAVDISDWAKDERALRDSEQRLRATSRELLHRSTHDPLTGLGNRAYLERLIDRGVPSDATAAVMFVDLDGFKSVNDRFGHETGDDLLVQVADRLRHSVRDSDAVVRLGGDEFVVVCRAIEPGDATSIARRLLAALGDPFVVNGHALSVGASIGLAVDSDSAPKLRSLLRTADSAVYEAKRSGRHQLVVHARDARD